MKIANHETCCGCGNCELVCKQKAIKVELNSLGFYKRILDETKCINCNACEKICPITSDLSEINTSLGLKCYYGNVRNKDLLTKTSSGGIASALADYWISNNRVVFGSSYSNNHRYVHTVRIDNKKNIPLLYGSKYVQSKKEDIFVNVKNDLNNNIPVLYIGLPCDIAALKLYLKRQYVNLYTCELICHGTTSTKALQEYLSSISQKFNSRISNVNMRYKLNEKWSPYYFMVEFDNGKRNLRNFWESDFGFAFSKFRNTSCYMCRFKKENRCADITLGDAWGAPKSLINNNQGGLSSILINSNKGLKMVNSLIENNIVSLIETSKKMIVDGNPNLNIAEGLPNNYSEIESIFEKNGLSFLVKRFRPKKTRIIIFIKMIMEKLRNNA